MSSNAPVVRPTSTSPTTAPRNPAVRPSPPPSTSSGSQRVASIDALRGFDMFWITGGGAVFAALASLLIYPLPEGIATPVSDFLKLHLNHIAWEGFSAWDLIMPLFLFIVGTAMPFSFAKRIEAGQSKGAMYRKVLLRTLILFVLGMACQGNLLLLDSSCLHVYCNTLQAIAVGYLIASIAMFHLRVWGQIAVTVALLVGYWALMMFVPIPEHGAGVLQEKVNLAYYIDLKVLGSFGNPQMAYTWVLSSMAFGAMVLLGVLSGHVLRTGAAQWKKVAGLTAIGLWCLTLGWAWSQEWLGAYRFPIIKHIFSSSMVLWAAGWSYLLLALFYLVIDVLGFRKWSFFFIVIGANAIFAYLCVELLRFGDGTVFDRIGEIFMGGIVRHLSATQFELLHRISAMLIPITGFAVLWVILWYMYRHKTFLRV